ncbi:MAG: nuclear transport factor 2 family protein [Sphingobacteriia bacterium]|nr:nuclear transport factor 2 family protein [Sphingobacteriia bacterium]
MDVQKLDIINQYINAYNSFNIDGMLILFAENCIFETVTNSDKPVKVTGKNNLKELATTSAKYFEVREQIIRNYIISENKACIEVEFRGKLASEYSLKIQGSNKNGGKVQLLGVSIFEFNSKNEIVILRDYS